jgi:hypothetical protein
LSLFGLFQNLQSQDQSLFPVLSGTFNRAPTLGCGQEGPQLVSQRVRRTWFQASADDLGKPAVLAAG